MIPVAPSTLPMARSFLFVPATRPERFSKALASGADAVIIDLEDAVATNDKGAARGALANAFQHFPTHERLRLVVRINASTSPWFEDDLRLVQSLSLQGLAGLMLPKAESPDELQRLTRAISGHCVLLPLIETVAGLDAANALAGSQRVVRLAFGNLDFQADAGLACEADELELAPVRLALVLASKRAKLAAPLDGVTQNTQDVARLQADSLRARRGGFGGKLCIHPLQIATVNASFAPSEAERDWAQRVIAAVEARGEGVFVLDGRMIDAPVILLARNTQARSS
jgi:citrate lyase subunit beta/citryl-CoA lyase